MVYTVHVPVRGPDRERDQRQTTSLLIKFRHGLPKEFPLTLPRKVAFSIENAYFLRRDYSQNIKDLKRAISVEIQNEMCAIKRCRNINYARLAAMGFSRLLRNHRRAGIFRGNIRENCFALKSFTRLRRKLVH